MSIVTDALNRLQAERSRASAPAGPSVSSSSSGSSPATLLSSPPPSKAIRNILRISLIIVALASVGIGAYLWGLTLMPDVAKVSPGHDTGPVSWSEVEEENQARPQSAETPPVSDSETLSDKAEQEQEKAKNQFTPGNQRSEVAETPNVPHEEQGRSMPSTATIEESSASRSEVPPLAEPSPSTPQPASTVQTAKLQQVPKVPPSTPNVSDSSLKEAQSSTGEGSEPTRKAPQARMPPIPRHSTPLEAKLAQAQYLIKKQRYRQAITVLQPLFVSPPDAWEPWFWLGTAKLGLGDLKGAEESFLEGLARNAAIPQLWVQRALVSQQQGEFGEALEALRQAELIAPDLPEVQLNLAYSLEIQGNIPLAVDHYHTFLDLTEGQKAYQAARKKVLERITRLEAA